MSLSQEARILIIDNEPGDCTSCHRILEQEGFSVFEAKDDLAGLAEIRRKSFDLILLDLKMPGIRGLDLIEQIHEIDPEIILIIITEHPTIESTVEAMKRGAYDYIPKPFSAESLIVAVNHGLEKKILSLEARTYREKHEVCLLESASEKSRTRTILGAMTEGILVTNHEGRLMIWNSAAASMLRLSGTDMPDQFLTHYTDQEAVINLFQEVQQQITGNFTMIRREIDIGTNQTTLIASVAPIPDEQGKILGTVTVLSDVTKLKEIDKIKSQFVSMVAHELRAPLAAIGGWLDVVLSGSAGDDPAKINRILEQAKNRSHSLLELVNDLLVINQMDAGRVAQNLELISLDEVISGIVELFAGRTSEAHIRLNNNLPDDLPLLQADRNDMERVFTNLIDNAIKYNQPDGRVDIDGSIADGFVCIQVKDSGVGISADDLPHIFEDFYRATDKHTQQIRGTGLGLAIVNKIIDSHHGQIEITSDPGKGSRFSVYLPQTMNQ